MEFETCRNWLKGCIAGKQQSARINDVSSDWEPVTLGFFHDSILGPHLLLIYVNDKPTVSKKIGCFPFCRRYKHHSMQHKFN